MYGLDELVKHFKWEEMHIQGPIVDLNKLDWLNGLWIRSLSLEELQSRLLPFHPQSWNADLIRQILPLYRERLVKLTDFAVMSEYFFQELAIDSTVLLKQSKLDSAATASYLHRVIACLEEVESWEINRLEDSLRQLQSEVGLKPKPAFMTIRMALTGQTATPPLFELMAIFGRDQVIKRLNQAYQLVTNH